RVPGMRNQKRRGSDSRKRENQKIRETDNPQKAESSVIPVHGSSDCQARQNRLEKIYDSDLLMF
ncbi:MAG: hypothetical protein OEM19_01745, partial [Deltaproteobacteria bacterium]|nr:hypothetical protein [Deltaproteobacteria bacterium]